MLSGYLVHITEKYSRIPKYYDFQEKTENPDDGSGFWERTCSKFAS